MDIQAMDQIQKNVLNAQTHVQLALKMINQEISIFALHVLPIFHFYGLILALVLVNAQKAHS